MQHGLCFMAHFVNSLSILMIFYFIKTYFNTVNEIHLAIKFSSVLSLSASKSGFQQDR